MDLAGLAAGVSFFFGAMVEALRGATRARKRDDELGDHEKRKEPDALNPNKVKLQTLAGLDGLPVPLPVIYSDLFIITFFNITPSVSLPKP